MNQGRRRNDGGAAVLENNMKKMKGYKEGGSNGVPLPRKKPAEPKPPLTDEEVKELEELGYGGESPFYNTLPRDMDTKFNPEGAYETLPRKTKQKTKSGGKGYETYASGGSMKVKGYSGGGMNCRGGGAAIRGTKFSGEF